MLKTLNYLFSCLGEFYNGLGDMFLLRSITRETIDSYKDKYSLKYAPDESSYALRDTREMDPLLADADAIRRDWEQVGGYLREAMINVQRAE